jgi:hypothetical protein
MSFKVGQRPILSSSPVLGATSLSRMRGSRILEIESEEKISIRFFAVSNFEIAQITAFALRSTAQNIRSFNIEMIVPVLN